LPCAVTDMIGTEHEVPLGSRDLLPRGLLGRVGEEALAERLDQSVRDGPDVPTGLAVRLLRRCPRSGAQVVGGHWSASTSSGSGIPGSISHSRFSIPDAAMCDA